jgi:hypothetical protein
MALVVQRAKIAGLDEERALFRPAEEKALTFA